ncbi:MAG: transposase [Synergistaceae bacterium]|jgi:transposase-like protein|nr:transposase [Synergistaceae bacterium]
MEQDCRDHFFRFKWPDEFKCPKCGHGEYFFIAGRNLYQREQCAHQASLTAGTITRRSRKGLREWFLVIYLFTHDKRGISASRLAENVGISYYTAWLTPRKLREAMSSGDEE